MKRYILSFTLLLLFILGALYILNKHVSTNASQAIVEIKRNHTDSIYTVQLHGKEDALQVMDDLHEQNKDFRFNVKKYSFGDFVTSLNGYTPNPTSAYWDFEVNGKQAQVGISQYMVNNKDHLEFILATI